MENEATLADIGEFEAIAAVTRSLPETVGVEIGPGDDAAVVHAPDKRVVVSCDMFVEGVHFRTDWASGAEIGRRCAIGAMADIFAMGAMPTALVVALAAPGSTSATLVTDIGGGIAAAAGDFGAGLVGGDMASAEKITIAVTVLGDLRDTRPVRRDGAKPGDMLALAGRVGWAAAGLDVLRRGFRSPLAVVGAYRVPEPPLTAGPIAAVMGATAMIDVSDGLLADAGHIAAASHVAIDVDSAALPVPPRLAEVGAALGRDPRAWLLTGGEDHALLATFPPGTDLPSPWQRIGSVIESRGLSATLPPVTVDGAAYEAPPGWTHFR